jgi:hypothetical protein
MASLKLSDAGVPGATEGMRTIIFRWRSASAITQSCGSFCACKISASDSSLSGADST